ncbi:MAG: hypothetical protein Q7I97_04125 [Thermovirgaceae bacterium]|nr:hypothetical protein [Thermovirgaceae bacterium]
MLILANGPGELWCWARPMIPALADMGFEVSLRLLPCQYAAGNETLIARNLGAADVTPPMSIFGSLVRGEKDPPRAVLQMGGDLLFGLALSLKNRVPLFCYTYAPKPLLGRCDEVFAGFEQARHTLLPGCDKVFVAGDLVADSLAMDVDEFHWPENAAYRVAFFPGSRRSIRSAALPFIKGVRNSLAGRLNGVEAVSALSPFASVEEIEEWRAAGLNPSISSTGSILKEADLAITQPGTNTLEMAYIGTPGIVALPFAFLRHVPLPGLKGAVASIPFAGPLLKEAALRSASRGRGFLAWPNRLTGREIMPEMVGDFSADDVAVAAAELLLNRDRREQITAEFGKITQGPGSAGRIAARIAEMVG